MEKSIFDFPQMPFFRSLYFGHFIYTFSENPKVTSLIEGRVHRLILPLLKALFGEYENSFASEKVGPTLYIFPF